MSPRGEKGVTVVSTAGEHLDAHPATSKKPSGTLNPTATGSSNAPEPSASMKAASRRTSPGALRDVSGPLSVTPMCTKQLPLGSGATESSRGVTTAQIPGLDSRGWHDDVCKLGNRSLCCASLRSAVPGGHCLSPIVMSTIPFAHAALDRVGPDRMSERVNPRRN